MINRPPGEQSPGGLFYFDAFARRITHSRTTDGVAIAGGIATRWWLLLRSRATTCRLALEQPPYLPKTGSDRCPARCPKLAFALRYSDQSRRWHSGLERIRAVGLLSRERAAHTHSPKRRWS